MAKCTDCKHYTFCETWGEHKCNELKLKEPVKNYMNVLQCPFFKKSTDSKDHLCHCQNCEERRQLEADEQVMV